MSNDSNSTIQILIDQNVINTKVTRIVRSDVDNSVSKNYGGASLTPKAGFDATVDITTLSKGNHTIKVRQLSRYGDTICELSRNINIENKKYSRRYMDR